MLSMLQHAVVTVLSTVIFIAGSTPVAEARAEHEVSEPSCLGAPSEAALVLHEDDLLWLGEWLGDGEVAYVEANGLTQSLYLCLLERFRESRELSEWLHEINGPYEEAEAAGASAPRRRRRVPTGPTPARVSEDAERWRPLVTVYFPAGWVEWSLRIIECESRGDPNAKNRRSSAAGLFQFLEGTWNWVAGEVGLSSYDSGAVFNPEYNIRAAAWLLVNAGTGQWQCKARR